MSTGGATPNALNARNGRRADGKPEEMGVFESIPALPFLVSVIGGEVHARLPQPLKRLLCRELHRVVPGDYAAELVHTWYCRDAHTDTPTQRTYYTQSR